MMNFTKYSLMCHWMCCIHFYSVLMFEHFPGDRRAEQSQQWHSGEGQDHPSGAPDHHHHLSLSLIITISIITIAIFITQITSLSINTGVCPKMFSNVWHVIVFYTIAWPGLQYLAGSNYQSSVSQCWHQYNDYISRPMLTSAHASAITNHDWHHQSWAKTGAQPYCIFSEIIYNI